MFLLAAAQGVAKTAMQKINKKVGWEIVVGAFSPSFGFEKSEEECNKIVDIISFLIFSISRPIKNKEAISPATKSL